MADNTQSIIRAKLIAERDKHDQEEAAKQGNTWDHLGVGGMKVGDMIEAGALSYLTGGLTNTLLGAIPGVANVMSTVESAKNLVGGPASKLVGASDLLSKGISMSPTKPIGSWGDFLGNLGANLQPNKVNVAGAIDTGLNVMNSKEPLSPADILRYGVTQGANQGIAASNTAETLKRTSDAQKKLTDAGYTPKGYKIDEKTGAIVSDTFTASKGAPKGWVPKVLKTVNLGGGIKQIIQTEWDDTNGTEKTVSKLEKENTNLLSSDESLYVLKAQEILNKGGTVDDVKNLMSNAGITDASTAAILRKVKAVRPYKPSSKEVKPIKLRTK